MIEIDGSCYETHIRIDQNHPTLASACRLIPDFAKINFDLIIRDNNLSTLEGISPRVGHNLWAARNNLTSLHNIHKHLKYVGISIGFKHNPIKSHVLGLLLIDGLQKIFLDNKEVEDIINKHLKNGRDIFACQEELIEAGFDEFANL